MEVVLLKVWVYDIKEKTIINTFSDIKKIIKRPIIDNWGEEKFYITLISESGYSESYPIEEVEILTNAYKNL